MERIKAIETYYKGYRFRSRLEARWAVFFDALGIKYVYEPEGLKLSDGTCYLPDFYLPESDSFFEVKGLMTDKDRHKIEQLIRDTEKYVTIGYDNCEFEATNGNGELELCEKEYSVLWFCYQCHSWFFSGSDFFNCVMPCCGGWSGNFDEYDAVADGNGRLTRRACSQVVGDKYKKAKRLFLSARFDHGETPIACAV